MRKYLFCLLLVLFIVTPASLQEDEAGLIAILTEVDYATYQSQLLLLNPQTREETVREIDGIVYNGHFFWTQDHQALVMSYTQSPEADSRLDYSLSTYDLKQDSISVHVTGDDVYAQSISPNQSQLLYNSGKIEGENRALDLFIYDRDTGDNTQLTEPPLLVDDGFWSPDGRMIAFTAFDSSEVDNDYNIPPGDIYIIDTATSHIINLSQNEEAWDRFESWSPDGTQIAYNSNKNGTFQIYIADTNGRNPKQISTAEGYANNAMWALDGTHLVYLQNDESGESEKMILHDLQTGEAKTLMEKAQIDKFDLSPDRTQVAYISRMGRKSTPTLCVFDILSEDEWCSEALPYEGSSVAWGS
jgi:dipeptidyl aminopeptidase/acylaminoacyl peptidase